MKYYMHKKGGHVATLDDDEPADLDHLGGPPEKWVQVHFHRGAKGPGLVGKIGASLFGLAVLGSAVGLLALVWKAVLS